MKKFHNISFAKQLTYYLLSALVITFILIAVALTNSLQRFIHNNAYDQARVIATNVLFIFDKQIVGMENIPNSISGLCEKIDHRNAAGFPERILKSYPLLSGCTIHFNPENPELGPIGKIYAVRKVDGRIIRSNNIPAFDLFHPDTTTLVRKCQCDGYWVNTKINQEPTLSLCTPFFDHAGQKVGMLKIDFPLQTITDMLCDYKIFQSGYLFIVDNHGNYIAHPDSLIARHRTIFTMPDITMDNRTTIHRLVNGDTGYTSINHKGDNSYLYFTPIPQTHWRMGIICPYNEIMTSSRRLFVLLVVSLGFGSLFLFFCTINIVHRLSDPLKQLAYTARQMAKGRFDVKLSSAHSSSEIQELYTSFRYMQQSIVDYIERLRITTAEKEQMNSEMRLARRIQQSFLPKHIDLPANVELFAELHQSREVGGDLYDYFVEGHRLYFVIGDVAGKGIPAALYMASISKFFRYVASDKHSTADICNIINKHTCDDGEDDIYITMFMGIIDMNTGVLTYTNAGHPYPLIIHDNGEISGLNKYPDVPIGLLEDHVYTEHVYTLHQNTSIVLYTDGITDSENIKSVFYGKDNLMNCIKSVPDKTPKNIIKTILRDIHRHTEGNRQSDDLTVLSVLYKGTQKSLTE